DTWLNTANRMTRRIGFVYRLEEKNVRLSVRVASWCSFCIALIDDSAFSGSRLVRIARASFTLFIMTISQRGLRGIKGINATNSAAGIASTPNIQRQSLTPVPFIR